ncbi:uncharacterized protein FYW61_000545 [Anableps anableps]
MTNLLLGVFLGLLAVIHFSPIDSMTQIPARPEEDVLEEVMTDGFLVEHFLGTPFTTEPRKINKTIQASQQLSLEVLTDGSGFYPTSMTESPEISTTIQQTFFVVPSEGSGFLETPTSPITEAPEITTTVPPSTQSTFETSVGGNGFIERFLFPTTESPKLSTTFQTSLQPNTDFPAEGNDDSSTFNLGTITTIQSPSITLAPTFAEESVQSTTTQKSGNSSMRGRRIIDLETVENSIASSGVSTKLVDIPSENNGSMHKGHTTPDWIIILAFLVGLAALIAVCAAIATRDKWNGPQQTAENKTNASNQKREVEMQTFLHKEEPKENGKEGEYTVIPLDDLADHYSSD